MNKNFVEGQSQFITDIPFQINLLVSGYQLLAKGLLTFTWLMVEAFLAGSQKPTAHMNRPFLKINKKLRNDDIYLLN